MYLHGCMHPLREAPPPPPPLCPPARPQVYDAYQFFHEPVTADPASPRNPLNILRRLARPQDFVAFKLDIDHAWIEQQFIKQILQVRGKGRGEAAGGPWPSMPLGCMEPMNMLVGGKNWSAWLPSWISQLCGGLDGWLAGCMHACACLSGTLHGGSHWRQACTLSCAHHDGHAVPHPHKHACMHASIHPRQPRAVNASVSQACACMHACRTGRSPSALTSCSGRTTSMTRVGRRTAPMATGWWVSVSRRPYRPPAELLTNRHACSLASSYASTPGSVASAAG